jgi:ribosomal protein S26
MTDKFVFTFGLRSYTVSSKYLNACAYTQKVVKIRKNDERAWAYNHSLPPLKIAIWNAMNMLL